MSDQTPQPPPRSLSLRSESVETAGEETSSPTEETFVEPSPDDLRIDTLVAEANSVLNTRFPDDEAADVIRKLVAKVEMLSGTLHKLQKAHDELETSLTLTTSNLTLALSNTEMLEEALQRSAGGKGQKDIGWRRWSDREAAGLFKRSGLLDDVQEEERRRALHASSNSEGGILSPTSPPITPSSASSAGPSPLTGTSASFRPQLPPIQASSSSTVVSSSPNSTPTNGSESRFFKFRFGGASKHGTSSLASASLPSLASASMDDLSQLHNTRVNELEKALSSEKKAREVAEANKAAIEEELEGLSAALFEEANKMVASERRRRAEVEIELKYALEEREALRGALRIVEGENTKRRTQAVLDESADAPTSSPQLPLEATDEPHVEPEAQLSVSMPESNQSPLRT